MEVIEEIYDGSSECPYGKFKGTLLRDVSAHWLLWAYEDHLEEMEEPHGDAPDHIMRKWALKGYVEEHLSALDSEVNDK